MFCWTCLTVYQYNVTNVMHFSFSLLRIKGLYMFRALLAHIQEAPHKQHSVYCVRIMSVDRCHDCSFTATVELTETCTQSTHILRMQLHQIATVQSLLKMDEERPKHVEALTLNKQTKKNVSSWCWFINIPWCRSTKHQVYKNILYVETVLLMVFYLDVILCYFMCPLLFHSC
jgi:hypothetical protein